MCVTNQVIWVKYLESWAFVLSGKVYEWKLICTLCPVDLKIKRAVSDCFYADEDSVEREFGSIIEKLVSSSSTFVLECGANGLLGK